MFFIQVDLHADLMHFTRDSITYIIGNIFNKIK